ncbi:MAG: NAD(P)/FAD-dependent oxidoreductase [Clostridia bacterium]|nr:NAD(P)/FAD-dependent oxidoreductase [Clostridia bacterium]
MKKVIVAGAGIGGLSAASNLAKHGYDVTLYEAKQRHELGYDWRDTILIDIFEKADFTVPDASHFEPHVKVCYRNPDKSRKLVSLTEPDKRVVSVDRQFLASHLVSECEKNGVKFSFGTPVLSAVTSGDRVTGVITSRGEADCDLLIDSAGMRSSVRTSLPLVCGVTTTGTKTDTLYTYRAYYERLTDEMAYPPFHFYFYHMGRKGIDWVITDKKYIDILIGSFTPLTQQDIDEAVADFRNEFPYMGKKIIRGGQKAKIPLGRTNPVIVCDGYAAVGDCAVMIEPLSGSGISQSMLGGKILADTVIDIGSNDITKEGLWKYQYRYFKEFAEKNIPDDIIKGFLSVTSADELDYLINSRILTEKEFSGGSYISLTFGDIMTKAVAIIKRPVLIKKLITIGTKLIKYKKVCSMMPENYNKAAIDKWQQAYLDF